MTPKSIGVLSALSLLLAQEGAGTAAGSELADDVGFIDRQALTAREQEFL